MSCAAVRQFASALPKEMKVIANAVHRLGLVLTISLATAAAQTPEVQELQKKLVEFEESTQKTIQALKAEIVALQQAQKASAPPVAAAVAQATQVPVVKVPEEYYGTETRT